MFSLGHNIEVIDKSKKKKEISKSEMMQMLFNLPHTALIRGEKTDDKNSSFHYKSTFLNS